jgi:hypothetical protein
VDERSRKPTLGEVRRSALGAIRRGTPPLCPSIPRRIVDGRPETLESIVEAFTADAAVIIGEIVATGRTVEDGTQTYASWLLSLLDEAVAVGCLRYELSRGEAA